MVNKIVRMVGMMVLALLASCRTMPPEPNLDSLYMIRAQAAQFTVDPKNPQHYILVLSKVSPKILWIHDRPERAGGLLSMEQFSQLWQKYSANVYPPNASLHWDEIKANTQFAFTLFNQQYDSKQETLIYTTTLFEGLAQKPPTRRLTHVELFVGGMR